MPNTLSITEVPTNSDKAVKGNSRSSKMNIQVVVIFLLDFNLIFTTIMHFIGRTDENLQLAKTAQEHTA